MLSKSLAGHIRSLRLKKFRDEHREFVAEGPKITSELAGSQWQVLKVIATEGYLNEAGALFGGKEIEVIPVKEKELERISNLTTPNKVLCVASYPPGYPSPKIRETPFLIALDGISDPGNFGNIIRTADWFGVEQIVCSSDCVDLFNPKVIQSTMGSFLRVGITYANLVSFLEENADHRVYGAFQNGENIFTAKIQGKSIVVIGSESHGIRSEVEGLIETRISIPPGRDGAESLNAATAASVIMAEITRKMRWS